MTKPIPKELLTLVRNAPATMSKDPVKLVPVPFGAPDYATARVVIRNIADTTPGILIAWSPAIAKVWAILRSNHIRAL